MAFWLTSICCWLIWCCCSKLVGLVLRGVHRNAGDHAQIVELAISLRLQLVLRVVGVDCGSGGLLIHQGALQRGLKTLVVGLRAFERQLSVEQLLLKLRIGEVHQDGVRSDGGAGQDPDPHDGCFRLSRNQLNAVFPRYQSAQTAYLPNHRPALDRIGPDRARIYRRSSRLQTIHAYRCRRQNHKSHRSPN